MTKFSEEHRLKLSESHLARNADRMEKICEMAKNGIPSKEIAVFFDMTVSAINKSLRKRGVKAVRGPNPKKGKSTNPKKIAVICQMAKDGKTAQEIADYYNQQGFKHNAGRIYEILNKAGVVIERKKPNYNPEKTQKIIEMYKTGSTVTEISDYFGYKGTARVSKVLCENGLRTHKPKRTDGYTLDSQGYLWVRVSDDDPMACMRTKRGTILEHRLNLARKLGRPLTDQETAHHINNNKQDNHPDNLQLRQLYHGKGVSMQCTECKSLNIVFETYFKCLKCGSSKIGFSEL